MSQDTGAQQLWRDFLALDLGKATAVGRQRTGLGMARVSYACLEPPDPFDVAKVQEPSLDDVVGVRPIGIGEPPDLVRQLPVIAPELDLRRRRRRAFAGVGVSAPVSKLQQGA